MLYIFGNWAKSYPDGCEDWVGVEDIDQRILKGENRETEGTVYVKGENLRNRQDLPKDP